MPSGQLAHAVPDVYSPARHAPQAVPVGLLSMPASHLRQLACPSTFWYLPLTHVRHAPTSPGARSVVDGWYLPAPHALHEAPSQYCPERQHDMDAMAQRLLEKYGERSLAVTEPMCVESSVTQPDVPSVPLLPGTSPLEPSGLKGRVVAKLATVGNSDIRCTYVHAHIEGGCTRPS